MKYKTSWSCSETKILSVIKNFHYSDLDAEVSFQSRSGKWDNLHKWNFPISCSLFHSLACSFGSCSISVTWIWPVLFPPVLPAPASPSLLNTEPQGFSPACVSSSHFILFITISSGQHSLPLWSHTVLAPITSSSFPLGSTISAAI